MTDQDVLLIPRGYHPFGAPAGYEAYYLNVMAGPNRAWHFTVDPDHAWLMDWDPQQARIGQGGEPMTATPSPLQRTASEFPTDYWNDSCNESELRYAMENGAVGATSNPVIVGTVMQQEYEIWAPRVGEIAAEHPDWTDQQVTWQIIAEMAIRGWKMLEPIYQANRGQKGRLSIQIDPTLNRSAGKMIEQARHFDTLAPNVQVKFPATKAGIEAMEAVTEEGISVNATVSFTVPQALAVGEAVEHALAKREAAGHDTS